MKNRIIATVLAVGLVASSCQKDDPVTPLKLISEVAPSTLIAPLFSTCSSLGRFAYAISGYGNGGYMLAGGGGLDPNPPLSKSKAILIKINEKGKIQWHQTYIEGYFKSIVYTSDNNYVITGYEEISFGGPVIMKVDPNGNIVWKKKFEDNLGAANSIIETSEGDYVVAGTTYAGPVSERTYKGWVIKLSRDGDIRWQKSYSYINQSFFYSVKQALDGSYIVAGSSNANISGGYNNSDFWLVNLKKDGDVIWQKAFEGPFVEEARSVALGTDGGYLLVGEGSQNVWMVKTDNQGNKLWQKSLGGSMEDYATTVIADGKAGYILAGASRSYDFPCISGTGAQRGLLIKVDNKGDLIWGQMYNRGEFNFLVKALDSTYLTGGIFSPEEKYSGNFYVMGITIP